MNTEIEVMTPAEIAKVLKVQEQTVIHELENGTLPGFRIGAEWRITREGLLQFIGCNSASDPGTSPVALDVLLDAVSWKKIGPFHHVWPNREREDFHYGFSGMVGRDKEKREMTIGFTKRRAAGLNDRARMVVFWGDASEETKLLPIVEFVGANDFDSSRRLASVIKRENGRHVKPNETLPIGYEQLPNTNYRDLVDGPYAARSLAVVASEDELDLMAKHAMLRSIQKGWLAPLV